MTLRFAKKGPAFTPHQIEFVELEDTRCGKNGPNGLLGIPTGIFFKTQKSVHSGRFS